MYFIVKSYLASPSNIPQLDGAGPDPELEDGLRLDPEPDHDPGGSYLGYRRRPYSVNRPWTQYDLDKKTLCASCGIALNVVRDNKIICNCMYIKKGQKMDFEMLISPKLLSATIITCEKF